MNSFTFKGHNPYFNRWFSAIRFPKSNHVHKKGHNPYFNRWFSAIFNGVFHLLVVCIVTILILIDGFLQLVVCITKKGTYKSHNPYFNRWFSAIRF